LPTTNHEFWRAKIEGNIARDRRVSADLEDIGWSVLVVWQCELSSIGTLTDRLLGFLHRAKVPAKA
jgi:G:T-mismatch repair DNA endonuclease (very short patch repair protein)